MDLGSNTGSLAPMIDKWLTEHPEPDQGSVTSRLAKECVSVFRRTMKKLTKEPEVSTETFRKLERSCSSLVLWDSGYGVAKGGIDDVLGKSRTLRRSTLEHLVNTSGALTDRIPPLLDLKDEELGPHRVLSSVAAEAKTSMLEEYWDCSDSDDSDDSDGSDSSSVSLSSDWDEIAEDIWTDVQCLLDLDPLIKFPAPDIVPPSQENQQTPAEWEPHRLYTDRIQVRFPNADPSLVDRLARANWERFRKGQADREESRKAALQPEVPGKQACMEVYGTVAQYTGPVSKFHDSGLGTSINTGSAYVETVMSYHREGGESVKIPPLSEDAKQGIPFECVACERKLVITNSSAWKKHLYLDLCPWICHDLNCNFGTQLFQNREDWIQHLSLEHALAPGWESFACPMCHEDTGDGKFTITRHLSNHMEEISLAALPAGIDADDDSGSDDGDGLRIGDVDSPSGNDDDSLRSSEGMIDCCACGHAGSLSTMFQCIRLNVPGHWFHEKCITSNDANPTARGHGWLCGPCEGVDFQELTRGMNPKDALNSSGAIMAWKHKTAITIAAAMAGAEIPDSIRKTLGYFRYSSTGPRVGSLRDAIKARQHLVETQRHFDSVTRYNLDEEEDTTETGQDELEESLPESMKTNPELHKWLEDPTPLTAPFRLPTPSEDLTMANLNPYHRMLPQPKSDYSEIFRFPSPDLDHFLNTRRAAYPSTSTHSGPGRPSRDQSPSPPLEKRDGLGKVLHGDDNYSLPAEASPGNHDDRLMLEPGKLRADISDQDMKPVRDDHKTDSVDEARLVRYYCSEPGCARRQNTSFDQVGLVEHMRQVHKREILDKAGGQEMNGQYRTVSGFYCLMPECRRQDVYFVRMVGLLAHMQSAHECQNVAGQFVPAIETQAASEETTGDSNAVDGADAARAEEHEPLEQRPGTTGTGELPSPHRIQRA